MSAGQSFGWFVFLDFLCSLALTKLNKKQWASTPNEMKTAFLAVCKLSLQMPKQCKLSCCSLNLIICRIFHFITVLEKSNFLFFSLFCVRSVFNYKKLHFKFWDLKFNLTFLRSFLFVCPHNCAFRAQNCRRLKCTTQQNKNYWVEFF